MAGLVAKIVRVAGLVAGGFLVVGALLYVLEANSGNWLVGGVIDVATWLATPFRSIFDLDENKAQVIINWGIGAAVYVVAAMLIAAAIGQVAGRAGRGDTRTKAVAS